MLKTILIILLLAFSSVTFSQKEEKLPKKTRTSVVLMTQHIIEGCSSERQKVDSIYTWITSNIDYDYKKTQNTNPFKYQTSEETLKSSTAICTGYVELMQEMLEAAGIKSEMIGGYTREDEPGFNEILFEEDHAWIAINIDDKWHLADPTWDAGYIGRIPKKEKTYPKSWTKEHTFSTETKREKWEKKIEEKKEKFDQKMSERDPYTGKIGFVSSPTKKYYLIHSDTFLITHLPTVPEWQLRKNAITIEQFSKPEDSVKLAIETPEGDTLEYKMFIDEYMAMNFLEKWLYTANTGYDFNERNHGVKAINNYNTVGVYLDSDLGKMLKRYPKVQVQPLWSDLIPITDTAIYHAKLAYKVVKESRKARITYYKKSFKDEATAHKSIEKEAGNVDKKLERIEKNITAANKRLKNDLKSIEEKIVKYQPYVAKVDVSKIKLESEIPELDAVYKSFDSINVRIDSIRKSIKSFREHSAQQGFLDAVSEARYHIEYSNGYVSIFNMGVLDSTAVYDTGAIAALKMAQSIVDDSVMLEIQSKELVATVKELDKFVKAQKIALKELEDTKIITGASKIEREMKAIVYERFNELRQFCYTSGSYHNYLQNNMKIVEGAMSNLTKRVDVLDKSREDRDTELLKELELEYDRGENLYKTIQTNAKQWNTDLKKRLK